MKFAVIAMILTYALHAYMSGLGQHPTSMDLTVFTLKSSLR